MASYDFSAPRLYIESPPGTGYEPGLTIELDKSQQNYLCNVLRLSQGKSVLVFNGRDGEWLAHLVPAGRKLMALTLDERIRDQTCPGELHYLFAPLKHARLDYIVQKAVEMGASAIRPVLTRRTQAGRVNIDRMQANAIEAAEQCGILTLPAIVEAAPLSQVLAAWDPDRTLIFCDEDAPLGDALERLQNLKKPAVAVLIGPEGGFDEAERAQLLAMPGVIRLSLGPRILRADTAGVAALALIQAAAGDWGGKRR